MSDIKMIRELIAEGLSDDEIADVINDAKQDDWEHERMYGCEREDERSTYEKELCDRLDMGRNDAGEWLGFC